jgi:hypothetical protein
MAAFNARDVTRIIRAHGNTVAQTGGEDELAELVALRKVLDTAIDTAVAGIRDRADLSWANIGAALGVTKSAAYQKYGVKK